MSEDKIKEFVKILEKEGWKLSCSGIMYINGTFTATLYKEGQDGEVSETFTLEYNTWADDEEIEGLKR